jgi:hypothetical protein
MEYLNFKTTGFKQLIDSILKEFQTVDIAGFAWYYHSQDNFKNSYYHDEYPVDGEDEVGNTYAQANDGSDGYGEGTAKEGWAVPAWSSRYDYYFNLASDHEYIKKNWRQKTGDSGYDPKHPSDIGTVGKGHRHWLDVNKIFDSLDHDWAPSGYTDVANSKAGAAARIEFLSQLLKMLLLADDPASAIDSSLYSEDCSPDPRDEMLSDGGQTQWCKIKDPVTTDNYNDRISNVSTSIKACTNTGRSIHAFQHGQVTPSQQEYINEGGEYATGFMSSGGYIKLKFTSPHNEGRQRVKSGVNTTGWAAPSYDPDLDTHAGIQVVNTTNHPLSLNPEHRGLGGIDFEDLYSSFGRHILDSDIQGPALPYISHDGRAEQDNSESGLSADGFYQGQIIYPACRWEKWVCRANFESFLLWARDLIEILDVYFAAKDWGEDIGLGKKPQFYGGKRYMSFPNASIGELEYSVDFEKLANNNAGYGFMTVDLLEEMAEEINRSDLMIPDDLREWWVNFLGAFEQPFDNSVPPEEAAALDITECIPEELLLPEGVCAPECTPSSDPLLMDWTLLDPDAVFFNDKACEYSIVVRLSSAVNPYGDNPLTEYIETGAAKLLRFYLKAEYIKVIQVMKDDYWDWEGSLGSGISESAGIFFQTLVGDYEDEESISTLGMLFNSDEIHSYLGFLPDEDDFPRISDIYLPEHSTLAPRILVSIPAKLFDRVPTDYTTFKEANDPEEQYPSETFVSLKASEFYEGNVFLRDMVKDIASAMKYYNIEYATWARFKEESGGDYGDLNLEKEADKIKKFQGNIKWLVENHGYDIAFLDTIKIEFEPSMAAISAVRITPQGCSELTIISDAESLAATGGNNFDKESWTNPRTLAYIQRLPDMWNDVNSRTPLEWNDFIVKYTINLKSLSDIEEDLDTTAASCWQDEHQSSLNDLFGGMLDDIVDLPSAFADKWNKKMCSGGIGEAADVDWINKEMLKEALADGRDLGMEEFFAGDQAGAIIAHLIANNQHGNNDPRTLWIQVLDKYGNCGILALLDLLLGCLLQGVSTSDGLALLLEAALKSLEPIHFERILVGLTYEQQEAIASKAAEALGVIFATPPWEKGIRDGSHSSGSPTTPYQAYYLNGKELWSGFNEESDGSVIASPDYGTYGTSNDNYLNTFTQDDYRDTMIYLNEDKPESAGNDLINAITSYGASMGSATTFPTYNVDGTLGLAATDVWNEIQAAYMDQMLSDVDHDEMLSMLNTLPGAKIIVDVLEGFQCNIPNLVDPPMKDWFSGLQIVDCTKVSGFVTPKIVLGFDIDWADFKKGLMDTLKDIIVNMLVSWIVQFISWLINMLLDSLCKLMGAFGAALTGDFRDAYRASFCDSEISDDELDAAAATLFEALGGCNEVSLQAVATGFISDLSLVLTAQELIDLLNGEASGRTLDAIVELASLMYPDTFGSCPGFSTKSGAGRTFEAFGKMVPPDKRALPPGTDPDRPIHPSLCGDDEREAFNKLRCELFAKRGLTPEQCEAALEDLRKRTADQITAAADFVHSGMPELPPMINPDPCGPGLFPTVDPYTAAAASDATKAILSNLETAHRGDLVDNHYNGFSWGTGGLINMIMSDKRGNGFNRAFEKVNDGDNPNFFPKNVATHLKTTMAHEDFIDFDSTDSMMNITNPRWGADFTRRFVWDPKYHDDSDYHMGHASTVLGSEPTMSRKAADITFKYEDYDRESGGISQTDERFDFDMDYMNFELDDSGNSIMNDHFGIRIIETATTDGMFGFDSTFESRVGFSGEQRTEEEVRELVSNVAESGSLNLDIESHLLAGKSPKNSLYARHVIETMKNLLPSSASEIEDNYGNQFNAYYEYCDDLYNIYFKKIIERISDSSNIAWQHGFPTNFEMDQENGFFDIFDLSPPNKVNLDKNFENPYTGEKIPITPEDYGGTDEYPAYYIPAPVYEGWTRILQTFAPPASGCEPAAKGACNFGNLAELYDNLFNTITEDRRLYENPACSVEAPWDKILDRSSTAGIEMTLRATIRILAAEWFIVGMPSFTVFDASSPSLFDDSILALIVDKLESSLLEQEAGIFGDRGMKNEYYFTFMSQAAHTVGRMLQRGEIKEEDLSSPELNAITELRNQQGNWEKYVAPKLAAEAFPGLKAAGIMAALGSPWGPEASAGAGILGSLVFLDKWKELKDNYWLSYVANPNNLDACKILLRRLVREELEFVAKQVSEDIEPTVSDMYNFFLVNGEFIIGAMESGGPKDVASLANGPAGVDHLHHSDLQPSQVGAIPFMLEKYIKITDYDYDYGAMSLPDEPYTSMFGDLTEDEVRLIRRDTDELSHLKGIVSIGDWEDYLAREDVKAIYGSDREIKDLWASWEIGLRISQVAPYSESASSVGWLPKADPSAAALGPASASTPSVAGPDITEKAFSGVSFEEQSACKAFKMTYGSDADGSGDGLFYGPGDYITLIPIISVQKESDNFLENTVDLLAGSLSEVYAAEEACLVSDLIKEPSYEMIFDYCVSLKRMISVSTIYVMHGFVPSIGSKVDWDGEWWWKLPLAIGLMPIKREFDPGGKKAWFGNSKFYGFDKRNFFVKSKGIAKDMFQSYYNTTNPDYKPSISNPVKKLGGISWSMFWWLRKLQKYTPLDGDGNPCAQ